MSRDFHSLTVTDVHAETPEATSVAFDVPPELADTFAFRQGQYLTVRRDFDGKEERRSYSICSGLDDGELRITVKKLAGGVFSGFVNDTLKPGDRIEVMAPRGRFTSDLDRDAARTYVGFAAGSGITPVLSIIKTVLTREPGSRFVLFYGNRSSTSIIFRDLLDDLKDRFVDRFSVHHVLSRESHDVEILSGRLDGERVTRLMRLVGEPADVDHVFLCGPMEMIRQARGALKALGVPDAKVHFELFTSAGQQPAEKPKPVAVAGGRSAEIVLDGVRTQIAVGEGQTILEAAEAAGLDVPYSCRGGMCCTCRARVTGGEVAMDINFSLEPWEEEAGFRLTCQGRLLSAHAVIDYDAL